MSQSTKPSYAIMPPPHPKRVDWVDYAKGFCIILVVMMHSTLGVGKATGDSGYMHWIVEFARPFRMPDFFLISGLFLANVIDRPWSRYLDRKVVHFFYFYVLWMSIQFAFKAPAWISEGQTALAVMQNYLLAFVQPFGTLWFIYILPIFFVTTRLLERLDWRLVLAGAALLEIIPVHTGALLVDEFAARFVYFFAGYKLAPTLFKLAEWSLHHAGKAASILAVWAVVNGLYVFMPVPAYLSNLAEIAGGTAPASLADFPIVSLALGCMGAVAVILSATLISKLSFSGFLNYLGAHSIVVYLAFFLPMGISRVILLKFAPFLDIGTVSLLVTVSGVFGAVLLYWLTRLTGFGGFLFKRPSWAIWEARLAGWTGKSMVRPAE